MYTLKMYDENSYNDKAGRTRAVFGDVAAPSVLDHASDLEDRSLGSA